MSLHGELLPTDSDKATRKPKRPGARPRGSRLALSRNPLFHHLVSRFPRFNTYRDSTVAPLAPQESKKWHRGLKFKDRQHIIGELANLFPHIDNEETRIDHAKNLEGFICEAANSKQEYEMLLSLFQKAKEEDNEGTDFFDFLSNCSSQSDDSDDSRGSSYVFPYITEEENSFSSDHDSNHYGGSESDE